MTTARRSSLVAAVISLAFFTQWCPIANGAQAPGRVEGIVGSEVKSVDGPWCDGNHLHQAKSLVISIRFPDSAPNAPATTAVVRRWDESSDVTCSSRPPPAKQKIIDFAGQKRFPLRGIGGFCVCGYNMRTECDAGGYLHYISDCFDDDANYCGYDDQVSGRC
jgi:hypothetical protein